MGNERVYIQHLHPFVRPVQRQAVSGEVLVGTEVQCEWGMRESAPNTCIQCYTATSRMGFLPLPVHSYNQSVDYSAIMPGSGKPEEIKKRRKVCISFIYSTPDAKMSKCLLSLWCLTGCSHPFWWLGRRVAVSSAAQNSGFCL